ncbi:MAG: PIN domain-containing protein [Gemmatimonadaceae bacterium]|nr:PIN domain-containing protein [Gemmatimonadaceae bacterium]
MYLVDVNVLVGAMRTDAPRHEVMRAALDRLRVGPEPFALCEPVYAGALRILTHPKIFRPPTPVSDALRFVQTLRDTPTAVTLAPGARHWSLFTDLVAHTNASGNLVADAWLAALALEHGCTMLSDDADFARFRGLRWERPDDLGS